jgi:hypothetical protein
MSNSEATPLDTFIAALKGMDPSVRAELIDRFDTATPEEIRELLRLRKQSNCARCRSKGAPDAA